MSHIHVRSAAEAEGLSKALETASRFALDCEAAGFHRYSDRLCLVQVTVSEDTWVVDPLAFDVTPVLRAPIEDPAKAVVMHGADFDLRLLSRDVGIRLRGLVDTQIQAQLIGEESLGLSSPARVATRREALEEVPAGGLGEAAADRGHAGVRGRRHALPRAPHGPSGRRGRGARPYAMGRGGSPGTGGGLGPDGRRGAGGGPGSPGEGSTRPSRRDTSTRSARP